MTRRANRLGVIARLARTAGVGLMLVPCPAVAEGDAFRPAIAVTPEGLTCVLGGNLDGEIVDSTVITPLMTHKQEYALVTMSGIRDIAWTIGRPREDDPDGGCEGTFQQELSIGPAQSGTYMVAVLGSKAEIRETLPKDLEILPPDEPGYLAVLRTYLQEAGIADPRLAIRQLISVDLDNDGEKEILINAVNTLRANTRKDEYSVLLVRRKSADGPQNVEIASEIVSEDADEPSPLWENTIAAILDLDNDGRMEIVLYGAFAQGDGWQVFRVLGSDVEQILSCGCGG